MSSEAKRFFESDAWKEVIASTRQSIKDEWANEKSEASRNRLWHTLNAIPEIEKAFRRIVNQEVRDERSG